MFVIDGQFKTLAVLGVGGETALKGDGVVVLIGLAGKNEILLRGQLAIQTVHAEVDSVNGFLHGGKQQLRLAYRHGIVRTDGFLSLDKNAFVNFAFLTGFNFFKKHILVY